MNPKRSKRGATAPMLIKEGDVEAPLLFNKRKFLPQHYQEVYMKKISIIAIATLLILGFCTVASHAGDVKGRYTYTEKGYSGTMTIKWMKGQEGRAYAFVFRTTSKSNGQSCEFEAAEMPPRVKDDRPSAGESDSGAKFKISFSGDTAIVTVLARGGECGMSGSFGGKYIKAKK